MFGWFNANEAVSFAKKMAEDIKCIFPPMQPPKPTQKERDKVAKNLENAFDRAANFGREKKLNIYIKAKYLNTLRWSLAELGYANDFIEDVIKEILFRMGKK